MSYASARHSALIAGKPPSLNVFLMRRGERMVRSVPRLRLLVPLVHRKVGDPHKFEVRRSAGLLEELVLVGKLLRQLQPQRPNPLVDPLRIVVPLLGRAEFGRDDDDRGLRASLRLRAWARRASFASIASASGAKAAFVFRRATSSESSPQSPKLVRISSVRARRLRAAETAGLRDHEAENGKLLSRPSTARAVRA